MVASDDFYQKILAKVNPLIDKFGTTYAVRGNSSYDSDTLETTAGSPRTVSGLVADQQTAFNLGSQVFPVSERSAAWIGKKNLLLKADTDPKPGEEIQVDGVWFPLAKVKPIKPADIIVLYILDITR